MNQGARLNSGKRGDRTASPRLFGNPLLDRFSRIHPLVPLLFYCPLIGGVLVVAMRRNPTGAALLGILGGYILWTSVEYLGHRFLFHYRPATAAGKWLQYLIHGVHHEHPEDPLRLVMPPVMSLPIMIAAGTVLRAACGASLYPAALAGFMAGYLAYDMLHFHIHNRQPKSSLGRFLRYRHMYHHYRDDSCWYGVSAPWWDGLLGTRAAMRRSEFRES